MTDQDEPLEPDDPAGTRDQRSEGVRIIGAQEAAEAADRPDVAHRRRRGEKGFGDRPDQPSAASDLPKITISTTEADPGANDPNRFGGVPVVRPGAPLDPGATQAPGDEPRWADSPNPGGQEVIPPAGSAGSYGHARVVHEPPAEQPPAEPPPAPDPASRPPTYSTPLDPKGQWPPDDEPDVPPPAPPAPPAEGPDDGFGDLGGDDSFVLPHWTEPPTGQVPRVVIAEEDDVDPLTTTGSQPRWRDEGERTTDSGFEDLIDESPPLGALGEPSASADDFFDSEVDRDPLEAFAPLDTETEEPRRRPARRRPIGRTRAGSGDDDGESTSGGGERPPGAGGGDRDLLTAIGVGVVLVVIGLLAFNFGGFTTMLVATLIIGAASFEYFTSVRQGGYNPANLLGIVAVVGLTVSTYYAGLAAYPVVLALTIVTGLLWYLWVAPGEHSIQSLGVTLLGIMWVGFLGSFATLLLGLGRVVEDTFPDVSSNPGIGVIIAAVIVAVSHDIGAYFFGKYLGKTPMSAASPNKTLEGLAGGIGSAMVVTIIVVGFIGIAPIGPDLPRTFVFALLCSLVAPLGDLCESFLKRDLGVKDMGTLLPGHGGVLDRFDALLFVLPTAYFVTILFDVWGGISS